VGREARISIEGVVHGCKGAHIAAEGGAQG
jgi:hypothetical protein